MLYRPFGKPTFFINQKVLFFFHFILAERLKYFCISQHFCFRENQGSIKRFMMIVISGSLDFSLSAKI